MNLYIGIDLGTSSVKSALVNENGETLKSVSKSYGLSFPASLWSEQNPEDWYEQSYLSIKELIDDVDKKSIKAISFSGQMHGLVMLDENDSVIRPAILWNDGRSFKQTDYLNEKIGKEALVENVGNIAFAGFTAPKLLWVKENEPEAFSRISKIMLPKDYLAYRLSDVFATDYSDASGTLYLDVKYKKWSKFMLDLLGINEKQLPELHESYDIIGYLKEEIANDLGLGKVKVVIGSGDNAAASIGANCVKAGDCNISLGTSGTVFYVADSFKADADIPIHSFAHANGGYHLMGCILSAASCNKWWVEDILKSGYQNENEKLEEYMGKTDVLFAPYLMGERCPYNDTMASGAFFNLKMNTSKEEMTLSVLEGVAFALRDCIERIKEFGLPIKRISITGGGCLTKVWPKIICNVLNMPISLVETYRGPSYGAAILAMVGDGKYKDVFEASERLTNAPSFIEPDIRLAEHYGLKYFKYKKLYRAIKSID